MENLATREIIIGDFQRKKMVSKNIILLLLGKLVSLFGSSIYSFAIGLYILKVTGSGLNFALTLFLGTVPRAILGPVSGVIADRVDRKKMAVAMDLLSGVIVLALVGLSTVDGLKLSYIYAATLLLSVASVFFDTTISSAVPNLVDDENLTKINSYSSAISSTAFILGPMIGGLIFALIDIKLFLLVNGLSFVFSGVSEMFMDFNARDKIYGIDESEEDKSSKPDFMKELKEGFSYIAKTKWLMVLGISAAITNMFVMMGIQVSVPVIAKGVWFFDDMQYGIAMGAFPAGMIIGSIVLSVIPQKEKNFGRIIIGLATFAVGMTVIGIFASGIFGDTSNQVRLIVLVGLFVILAFASAFLNIPLMVTMQKLVPNEKLGRVYGVFGTLATIMMPIGAILGGVLLSVTPAWTLPFGCGLIMIVIVIITAKNEDLKKV